MALTIATAHRHREERSDAAIQGPPAQCPPPRGSPPASGARTGPAAVVTEARLTAGPAAEISALIQEECFDFLEEPILRIAGEDIPIPVSPELETRSIPTAELNEEMVGRLVR